MIEARMHDGTSLQFPDGTDDAVVDRAVREHLATPPETPPPKQSTLGQIGQYVNKRFTPSQETETWLQNAGVYNKPGENNPLRSINSGIMNPIIGLFGGAAQTAGDAIHGGLKLVNDTGNAVSPGLGRDLAGIAEMAIGSGRFGVSGKILGRGFPIPNLNPARAAVDQARASAIGNASNLATDSRAAAVAENAAGAGRVAAENAAGVRMVADANAQAAQFGKDITRANKEAGQFGADASRATSAQVAAETPRPAVASPFGEVPSSAGIGQSVQNRAIAAQEGRETARRAQFVEDTVPFEAAVAKREAAREFLKDDPEALKMLARSRRALDDPAAGRLLPPDRMAHEAVVSALKGQPVKIPESMVPQMQAEGHTVVSSPGSMPPTFSVTFSNTVEGVNNVRRMFGEAFKTDVVGWGAINSSLKKDIYRGLDNVLRSYVGDAHTVRQANYHNASSAIDAYRTTIGRQLTANQKGTTQPRTTPSQMADIFNTADPSVLAEVRALSGVDVLPSVVARAFRDPVTGMSISLDAAREAIKPGSKLADALAAHPELNAAVRKHISALETEANATIKQSLFAERQGAISEQKLSDQLEATNRAKAATKGQTKAQKLAEKLSETSAKDAANIRETSEKLSRKLRETETAALQDIANLERMPAREVLPYARAMLERMSPAKGGPLTMDQYTAALAQLDKAKSTADLQRRLLRIVGAGLAIAGTPVAGRVVYNSITGGP